MIKIPISTYRIQFTPSFGFEQANRVIEYLAELGITCLYASPIFKTKAGSQHGYDVVDHQKLNPELGTEKELAGLRETMRTHDMLWLQDFVPNHMAYDYQNGMLMDVLENAAQSKYRDFFDVNWQHPYEGIHGRLLAPFLGKPYWKVLENGDIKLEYDGRHLVISVYGTMLFPLNMESYAEFLTHDLARLRDELGENHPDFVKLLGVLYVLHTLNEHPDQQHYQQAAFVKDIVGEMYLENKKFRQFIDDKIEAFNGQPGEPASFDLLDCLLRRQYFRLAFWKVATEEINYRRFFSINGLICLQVQKDEVFDHIHEYAFKLLKEDMFDGLRIDHIDGLYNPVDYLWKVRNAAPYCYLVVEKILDPEEQLPPWPVQGTTGYDYLFYLNNIFCDKKNEQRFTNIYNRFAGMVSSLERLKIGKKRLILVNHMTGDVDNLANCLKKISSRYRYGSDITLYGLKRGITEMMVHFPVYRTYSTDESTGDKDREYVQQAADAARRQSPELVYEIDFIERFLLLKFDSYETEEERSLWVEFMKRFQQYTGPLMAKGFEDTTLYVYNRLISLNEVGGDPGRFGISIEEFHEFNERRARDWPHTQNATSTHDTKRGEDVRARINVLSELPDEWEEKIEKWRAMNLAKKQTAEGITAPDENDEYFLYQTLIGAYPFGEVDYDEFKKRIKDYMMKAVNEAKSHTAWLSPDVEYQDAVAGFIDGLLDPSEQNEFLRDFLPFQQKIASYGILNSLSQTLIKIAAPGIPDFYQGTELWDLNLVDPDNRRPVDFDLRINYLQDMKTKEKNGASDLITELFNSREDGRIKLFLIRQALQARRRQQNLFMKGRYMPLWVEGKHASHVVAFARELDNDWALAVVPRLLTGLISEHHYPLGHDVWQDTQIQIPRGAPTTWRNSITGKSIEGRGTVEVGEVLKEFPVALLVPK